MVGALIRVLANRFAWHVKDAILETLVGLLQRTAALVKNFLPQLQTIFVKSLSEEAKAVRIRAAEGLSLLMPFSARVDALVLDLLGKLETEVAEVEKKSFNAGYSEALLHAIYGTRGGAHMHSSTNDFGLIIRMCLFEYHYYLFPPFFFSLFHLLVLCRHLASWQQDHHPTRSRQAVPATACYDYFLSLLGSSLRCSQHYRLPAH
tara:strand:+ start:79 stop:693 length:615 start_codon:yes stop_codon:yes gene_type:complete